VYGQQTGFARAISQDVHTGLMIGLPAFPHEVVPMSLSRRSLLSSSAALACGGLAIHRSLQAAETAAVSFPRPPQPDRGLLFSCKYGMTQGGSLEERLTAAREAGMDGVDFDDAAAVTPEQLRQAAATTGVFIHGTINHAHWSKRLTSPDPAERAVSLANLEHCIRVSHAAGGSGVLLVIGRQSDGPDAAERAREEISKAIPLAAALGQRILFENVWNGMFYEDDGPRDQSAAAWAAYIDSFKSPWIGAFFDLGNHARYGDVAAWIRELGPRIVKLDIKGYSVARADAEGKGKGFVDITAGDIDWRAVRAALAEVGFTGWVSAEVRGGDVARLKTVLAQMQAALLG
jgi:L-ribulose-5-phosphate 3-epimerase